MKQRIQSVFNGKQRFSVPGALAIAAALILALAFVQPAAARGSGEKAGTVLKVGASPIPHAELLELIKNDLAAEGIKLEVVEFTDYIVPNTALISGELDANYFQTVPYLESNDDWKAKLSFLYGIHVEPFGLYSQKYKTVAELPQGATIAIPNDPANGGRALLLFQANGLIKLKPEAGLRPTDLDVIDNPRGFRFRPLEAAQLPRSLADVDGATINGNYALEAGINPVRDSLIIEGADSPYVNGVVVRKGDENDPRVAALKKVLQSQKVRDYISSHFDGGVVATF
ncbi:MAG: MetQ/NlpA family ABC transporter substrate-binding protein [Spirochaetaceae bacterium]|jgi:D-methionine transport system substrate-binding protein|nr:MetQ/NlpA family ABC transporter substrate-binding protein [Spirochaetaceae bacterium]